ncbi:selenide, water dikinase SelD [Micromonospora sp. NPDC049301]|uniref:selenide, water dikinase SelD n=1 Tax=Micromonospora sp. NPDC049301 TaxID=3155723 RepID=UPI00344A358B
MQFSPAGGCGCKLGPGQLSEVLSVFLEGLADGAQPVPKTDDRLIVGLPERDDAAVYVVADDLAIILTADFFTPIDDDARRWGAIAAANAMSDVYAMGGTPRLAVNLVEWPDEVLPMGLLAEVLRGAESVTRRAGAHVVGGHTLRGAAPKFGMAVVGFVAPDAVLRISAASPGDRLILTKPLGTGLVSTGLKNGLAPDHVVTASYRSMVDLNDRASQVCVRYGVRAATDVTGFGLLGHLQEMCLASDVSATLTVRDIPVLPGVEELVHQGMTPGGAIRNWDHFGSLSRGRALTDVERAVISDPQTSGGLLLAAAEDLVDVVLSALTEQGVAGRVIGSLTHRSDVAIELR